MAEHALVICNGEPPGRTFARGLAKTCDLVLAADGGANIARRYGITPDVITGDLDSITPTTRRAFSRIPLLANYSQYSTDLEKCLDLLVQRNVRVATVIAATGNRLDFTLGNLSVIWNYISKIEIRFAGDGWIATPVGGKTSMRARRGTTVSLIPFGRCSGITLTGLRYPLRNATMKVGEIGVSNVVKNSPFTVSVKQGHMLLLVLEPGRRVRRQR